MTNHYEFLTTIYNSHREESGVNPDITARVRFTYLPGRPAYTSGLPENYYPAESDELEIYSITSPASGRELIVLEDDIQRIEDEASEYINSIHLAAQDARAETLYADRKAAELFD